MTEIMMLEVHNVLDFQTDPRIDAICEVYSITRDRFIYLSNGTYGVPAEWED